MKVSTHGYDLLVQVDEVLINKALAALYYSGFLSLQGEHHLVEGIPENIRCFTSFSYRIRLKNEPLIDYRGSQQMYIRFAVELKLVVLTGIVLDFDVSFYVAANLFYDALQRKMALNVSEAAVSDFFIDNVYQFNKGFIDHINQVFTALLNAFFQDAKTIDIPTVLYRVSLPMMPEGEDYQLPIRLGDILINDKRLAMVGINFFEPAACDAVGLPDYTGGSELYIAMQQKAMQGIFEFWWDHTTSDKTGSFQGSVPLSNDAFLEKGAGFLTRLVTLGFIQKDVRYDNTALQYEGTVTLAEKPVFEFGENNLVILHRVKLGIKVRAWVQATVAQDVKLDTSSFLPDSVTPWEDDRLLKHSEGATTIFTLAQDMDITLQDAQGVLQLNDQNQLVIDVMKADFKIELGDAWYEHFAQHTVNTFLNLLERKIVDKIPDLVVSPTLLNNHHVAGYTMQVELDGLSFSGGELSLQACVGVEELANGAVPVPMYVGNTRTRKVHLHNCQSVDDMEVKNRVGYYVLYEALKAGYSTCRACIGAEQAVNEEGAGK